MSRNNYRGRGRGNYGGKKPLHFRYNRNTYIRSDKVQLVDSDGENKGVVDTKEALKMAQDQGLDLVEVAPNADPPVCKIISWSKFKYEKKKKEKQSRKNKQKEMKELRFGSYIADGDKDRQLDRAREFLDEGHNVKLTVVKKNRRAPMQQAKNLMNELLTELSDYSTIDERPSIQRNLVSMMMKGGSKGEGKKEENNAKTKDKKNSSKKVQKDKSPGREKS